MAEVPAVPAAAPKFGENNVPVLCGATRAELAAAGVNVVQDCPNCGHRGAAHPSAPIPKAEAPLVADAAAARLKEDARQLVAQEKAARAKSTCSTIQFLFEGLYGLGRLARHATPTSVREQLVALFGDFTRSSIIELVAQPPQALGQALLEDPFNLELIPLVRVLPRFDDSSITFPAPTSALDSQGLPVAQSVSAYTDKCRALVKAAVDALPPLTLLERLELITTYALELRAIGVECAIPDLQTVAERFLALRSLVVLVRPHYLLADVECQSFITKALADARNTFRSQGVGGLPTYKSDCNIVMAASFGWQLSHDATVAQIAHYGQRSRPQHVPAAAGAASAAPKAAKGLKNPSATPKDTGVKDDKPAKRSKSGNPALRKHKSVKSKDHAETWALLIDFTTVGREAVQLCHEWNNKAAVCSYGDGCSFWHLCKKCWVSMEKPLDECKHAAADCAEA